MSLLHQTPTACISDQHKGQPCECNDLKKLVDSVQQLSGRGIQCVVSSTGCCEKLVPLTQRLNYLQQVG